MGQVDYAALAQQHGGAAMPVPSIGAAMHNTALPDIGGDNDPDNVTLGQLMENPTEAMQRIGANLKRDAKDPRTWMALAASYFGPKMAVKISPMLSRAAVSARAGMGAVATPGMVKDLATVGLGDGRVSAGLRIGSRVADAVRAVRGPASSAPPAEPVASTPVVQEPPAAQSARGTGPAQTAESAPSARPKNSLPDQRALNEEALARRRSEYQARAAVESPPTLAESNEYVRLVRSGKTPQEATAMIQAQREFQARLGIKTPSVDETKFPKGMRGKVTPE